MKVACSGLDGLEEKVVDDPDGTLALGVVFGWFLDLVVLKGRGDIAVLGLLESLERIQRLEYLG